MESRRLSISRHGLDGSVGRCGLVGLTGRARSAPSTDRRLIDLKQAHKTMSCPPRELDPQIEDSRHACDSREHDFDERPLGAALAIDERAVPSVNAMSCMKNRRSSRTPNQCHAVHPDADKTSPS